jgi:hypothetical protein
MSRYLTQKLNVAIIHPKNLEHQDLGALRITESLDHRSEDQLAIFSYKAAGLGPQDQACVSRRTVIGGPSYEDRSL